MIAHGARDAHPTLVPWLDRPTSGVVLAAKDRRTQSLLQEALARGIAAISADLEQGDRLTLDACATRVSDRSGAEALPPVTLGISVPYAKEYRMMGADAELLGSLAAENCPGKFLITPLEFARFLDEIESEWVSAYFDIGNALWYGCPEHWIPVLGSRVWRVHVKDNRLMGGGTVAPAPLLAGDVNWPAVREALAAIRYDSWLTAEVIPGYRYHGERLIYETSASMDAIFGRAETYPLAYLPRFTLTKAAERGFSSRVKVNPPFDFLTLAAPRILLKLSSPISLRFTRMSRETFLPVKLNILITA